METNKPGSVWFLAALVFSISLRPALSEDHNRDDPMGENSFWKCPEKNLSAPYASQISSHTIALSWFPLNCSGVVYIPQWTGPSYAGAWVQKENVTVPMCMVEDLQPFTIYKFRIWAVISEAYAVSPESPAYITEPFGVPSSPVIESVLSDSGVSVEVGWSPPEVPGGIIVGYNLNLTSDTHTVTVTTAGNVFYTSFYPTLQNTTYRISVAAVNREGQGAVAEASITTPPQAEQNGPRWVFASRMNSLRRQDENDFYSAADCLPDEPIEGNITGVAVHPESDLVYFSEGTRIWAKGVGNLTDLSDLRRVHSADAEVTALSVDWLYRKLYYVSDDEVWCCKLGDCSSPVKLNLTLTGAPRRIVADPYNGYLFLLLHDGIHRASLPEPPDPTGSVALVLQTDTAHDFVVSFPNERLVFYDRRDLTLSAVSLDGSRPVTLYSEIKVDALSLAYEDDLLMLTDGRAVYKQTGNGQVALFTEFFMDCDVSSPSYDGFGNVRVFGRYSQPYPVPRTPTDLQVLFGAAEATLRWSKPKLSNGSSPSAWQNWTYSVKCSANGSAIQEISDITTTHAMLPQLQSRQSYIITVMAASPGGRSHPATFQGQTLKEEENAPFIAAASDAGLWRQQFDRFDFDDLLESSVRDVKDMDWYNSTIFWTNGSGWISWKDMTDHFSAPKVFRIPGGMTAKAVAFDWLGRCLYWSCNVTMICRGPEAEVFLNTNQKIESLLTDSPNAAIYWSTETTLEVCRFDGARRRLIENLSVISGRKIAGITADWDERFLYWLVEDGSFLHLYRAHLSTERSQDFGVTPFLKWSLSSVLNQQLSFYSGRLLWLDDEGRLRIQELNQTRSVLMSPNNRLTAFTVLQRSLKPLPDGFASPPSVIPPAVSKSSIRLNRNETLSQITWDPSRTNFGTVFYCVRLNVQGMEAGKIYGGNYCPLFNTVSEPVVRINNLKPNSIFNITITPFTHWGRGESTSQTLSTPDAVSPSEAKTQLSVLIAIVALLALIIITTGSVIYFRRRRKKAPRTEQDIRDEAVEMTKAMVGLGKACYAVSVLPVHEEIETLPVFPRESLTLLRLLGSGAFGDVYEGVSLRNGVETRVAIKTLQTGASDQEKAEFLKEAHLMSQFNHPNILCLLGVCVHDEPRYLILELMEGGDLRSYLRGARPTTSYKSILIKEVQTHAQLLTLVDLLTISLDVTRGCAYLEKLHFVHRDLAARNCLVSVKSYTDPERVVKLGDFGLARDVYKCDYYRKRGEGLLPVRWMPPESLTDGIFNKHSDVWAFGVLLWEIMTLAKQPYPALSNQEVLHHVNAGGRLQEPPGCPQKLCSMMQSCWRKEPGQRPSFRSLHWTLEQIKETETLKNDGNGGHTNLAYQEDEEEEFSQDVDEDEGLGSGLTHVLSSEGLNYLMYRPDRSETSSTNSNSSSTETVSPTENG